MLGAVRQKAAQALGVVIIISKSRLAVLTAVLVLAVSTAVAQTPQSGPGWIIDPAAQCGTSNPFASGRETISWSGRCLRGRLHGPGILIWFEDGIETERDEGAFRNGELDGGAIITLADRTRIFGNYRDGIRHGEFMIVRPDGTYVQSIYAEGRLVSQRPLDWRAIKSWRDARKGDKRATRINVEAPVPSIAATTAPPAAPQQTIPPQATSDSVPSRAPAPLLPAPLVVSPMASQGPATPGTRRAAPPLATSTSGFFPATAVPTAPIMVPKPLMQYVRVDGQPMLIVAAYIPGGINMVPRGSQASVDQFGEARLLRQMLGTTPPHNRTAKVAQEPPRQQVHLAPSAATAGFGASEQPTPRSTFQLRPPVSISGVPRDRLLPTPPTSNHPGRAVTATRLQTQLALRQLPGERIRLRPPPSVAATSESLVDAPAAPPTARASKKDDDRLALNLAGADLRDATQLILGNLLKVRFMVDPEIRGTIANGPNPNLRRDQLVPWLRNVLHANGADLVITPAGYRVYSLQRASSLGALPTLAPPAQAESVFVQAYTAERAGRNDQAAKLYTQLTGAYPSAAIGGMARERLAALQQRLNAPQRQLALPERVALTGAYLCTRIGLFPRNSKWCGFVRGEAEDQLQIEVREIAYNGLFAIGFGSTTCTGGVFIGPLTHGRMVTVPRVCMEARW